MDDMPQTKYTIIDRFLGYQNKGDVTKVPPGFLVKGSQNVLVRHNEIVYNMANYSLDGDEGSSVDGGVVGSYDWLTNTKGVRNVRSGGTVVQARYKNTDGDVFWVDIMNGLTSSFFQFTPWWDAEQEIDSLLGVNGDSNIYKWSGGMATFGAATSSTITLEDTTSTWAAERFYLNTGIGDATTQFDITNPSGTTYRYTWDSTGTNPNISAISVRVGSKVYVKAQNFTAANNGVFTVTNSGANFFEVTNTSGVVESNKTIGTGFIEPYAKAVIIDGDTYYYGGGAATNQLTNVTPDPSLAAYTVGTVVAQGVITYPNVPASDSTYFTNDLISTLYNQVWVGSSINNEVYVSDQSDFTNFSFTDPRLPGEGSIIRLDAPPRAFAPNEESMQTSAGESLWYKTVFKLGADNVSEAVVTTLLKSGASQGAISQGGTFYIKNSVVYISNEPTLDSLGKVENITTQQTVPISDPIKDDFDVYNFLRVHGQFHRNNLFIALPLESKLLMYDIQDGYWNPPMTLPAGRIAIIDGELYLHSNSSLTTYKLFDKTSTEENVILSIARFSYINNGDRVNKKQFNERYIEGFISSNSTLTRVDRLDWEGASGEPSADINGNDSTITIASLNQNPLGENPLGDEPLGDTTTNPDALQRFRVIRGISTRKYREIQVDFTSQGVNENWELTSFGWNTTDSSENNFDISK